MKIVFHREASLGRKAVLFALQEKIKYDTIAKNQLGIKRMEQKDGF